jgi:putative ABC transport system permease protein
MRLAPVTKEAWSAAWARPARTALTVLGTVAGVATLVATLGLAATARQQVSERFDVLAATEVVLEVSDTPDTDVLPDDLTERLRRLPGVQSSGALWRSDVADATIRRSWDGQLRSPEVQPPVFAASRGALDVIGLTMSSGVAFEEDLAGCCARVVLVSQSLADRLRIVVTAARPPAVFIGDIAFTVIGVYDSAERHPEVLAGLIVPSETTEAVFGLASSARRQVIIETRPGAAGVVADQAPVALRADTPAAFTARATIDPRALRSGVDDDITGLLLALAALSLLIGMFSVANTTLIGVLERVPEIGLRRAVGATRAEIAVQFIAESALAGTAGGAVGSSVAVLVVVAVSAARSWTPTMDLSVPLLAPLLGTVTGLVAGLLPARRAAGVEPADALRRGL